MTSAKEGADFESILPQQKNIDTDDGNTHKQKCSFRDHSEKTVHAKNSGEVTSAKEGAVLETILPQQKKETTIIHAKNSEKVRAKRRVRF